jgi:acetyl-CoA carboxylase biotin carboxyl carrier protein
MKSKKTSSKTAAKAPVKTPVKVSTSNANTAQSFQDFIGFVADSGLAEVNLETNGFKIHIKRYADAAPAPVYASQPVVHQQPVAAVAPATSAPAATQPAAAAPAAASNLITIKSPMIGTFYRSSSPDTPVFVNIGDTITPGKSVCVIEAMKLFNEIESEVSGKIVKILVDNASPVEYDQPLFLVEPK